jgi:hypothetical protein
MAANGTRITITNPQLTVKWLVGHAPKVQLLFEGLGKAGLTEE